MEIILVIILVCIVFWPWISKWLRTFMMRRAEDSIRRMFGMPTRKEEEKARKRKGNFQRGAAYGEKGERGYSASSRESTGAKIVKDMKMFAEDVDYVEIKDDSDSKGE